MKCLLVLFGALQVVLPLFGQQTKNSCCISKKDLVGIWQRDTKRVGNGLIQNFHFFDDGSFVVNFTNENEDARGIIAISGSYRLEKDQIYLKTMVRTVIEGGEIIPTGSNETYHIFTIRGGEIKEIQEAHPKEHSIYVILNSSGCIELSNETYYKVGDEDLKSLGIDPKAH